MERRDGEEGWGRYIFAHLGVFSLQVRLTACCNAVLQNFIHFEDQIHVLVRATHREDRLPAKMKALLRQSLQYTSNISTKHRCISGWHACTPGWHRCTSG